MRTLRLAAAVLFANISAAYAAELVPYPAQSHDVPFPTEEWPEYDRTQPDRLKVDAVVAKAFRGNRPPALAKSKAFLVISAGRIISEHYAPGLSRNTRQQSWSTAKSFLHAAIGIAIIDGLVNAQAPARVPEWQSIGDPRRLITVRQLAQMTDGLDFAENYSDPQASVMQMLFGAGRGDVAHSAASASYRYERGTHWNYSGGSANILSRMLRDKLGGKAAYRNYLVTRLFQPLGIKSAVPEFDASGTWIASSYIHATARDFARFGLLYLRGGFWEDRQIVSRDWIDVGRTPTLASNGQYGALFWLNAPHPDTGIPATFADLPEDIFYARGFGGQLIGIIPSHDVVIVMLNVAYAEDPSPIIQLISEVLRTVPPPQAITQTPE